MPQRLFDALIEGLIRREALAAEADLVRRPRAGGRPVQGALSATEQQVAEAFAGWGHTPPRTKEVARELQLGAGEAAAAMDRLVTAGILVKVKSDLLVHTDAVDALRERLLAHLDEHGQITPAEWKELTAATRKWSIPLAEYFDQEKVTLRVGDVRKRRGGLPQRK
jgi:selenocysteine-specific elongation factor